MTYELQQQIRQLELSTLIDSEFDIDEDYIEYQIVKLSFDNDDWF